MSDRPHVLVVDDESDVHELVALALRKCGASVHLHAAYTGAEALEFLFGTPGGRPPLNPALVILDVRLPDMNGVEILRLIRATPATEGTPVVVQTMTEQPSVLADAYHAGADAVITKHVNFADYRQILNAQLMQWLHSGERLMGRPPETRREQQFA